jgi:hypothetical protein
MAVLFTGIDSQAVASQLKIVLLTTYPKDFSVFLVVGGVSSVIQLDAIDAQEISTGTCLYVPPLGEGIAQVPEMVDALLERGYDGWFVLEQDTCVGDPKDVARVNREYLEALLAGAGSR